MAKEKSFDVRETFITKKLNASDVLKQDELLLEMKERQYKFLESVLVYGGEIIMRFEKVI